MNPLHEKVAIVTGGTRGIGRAIARALLREDARVVICSRNPDEVKSAASEMEKQSPGAVAGRACDVRQYQEVRQLVDFTVRKFGGLDILVNNAGVGLFGDVAELKPEEWAQVVDTNLTGVFYCCHEAVPRMRHRGGGYIINISSLAGKNAFKGGTAYNASKFGLTGFSEALMQDVRYDNIRVSDVMPGSVSGEFAGGRRSSSDDWKLAPEDVARVVVDLLKHDPRSLPSRVELRPSKPRRD